jgi:hypothetical protein
MSASSERIPVIVNVKLEDLREMQKHVKAALNPQVTYNGDIKAMRDEADQERLRQLYLLSVLLGKYAP